MSSKIIDFKYLEHAMQNSFAILREKPFTLTWQFEANGARYPLATDRDVKQMRYSLIGTPGVGGPTAVVRVEFFL